MSVIWKSTGKVVFGAFVLALLAWAGNLTVHAVLQATGDPFSAVLALALFDVGAFAWLITFMNSARGTGQRTTALLLTGFDLVGVVWMTAGGLGVIDPAAVTFGLVVATGINYAGWYVFKLSDVEVQQAIQEQNLEDTQFEESLRQKKQLFHTAMQQTRAALDRDGAKLAEVIAKRNYISIKNQLNLDLTAAERKAWERDAIDADFTEIPTPALTGPATPGIGDMFGAWLKSFFGQRLESMSNASTSSVSLQSSNEQESE